LPPASYTSGASIYSCFFERPVVVNLAVSTEEKTEVRKRKSKNKKKRRLLLCTQHLRAVCSPPLRGYRAQGKLRGRLLQALTGKRPGAKVKESKANVI